MSRSSAIALSAALVAAALVAAPSPAAAVPEELGLTARVFDAGTPITGDHALVVRLHTAATGGAPVWSENQTVAATDGLIHVALGSVTPLTAAIVDGGPLWVELQLDATVLTPRIAVTSAAYAIRAGVAEDAELLDGRAASSFATATHAHTGTYLPLGATLACTGSDKVASINPTTGSISCAPDLTGPTYTAGVGIGIIGTSISVAFAGTGTTFSAARSDHNHAGVYLPLGATLTCPLGQFQTGVNTAGSAICAAAPGDISSVTVGAGLTGGGPTGAVTVAVAFGGTGGADAVARSDHSHTPVCPTGYNAHAAVGAVSPLCVKRVASNVTWGNAATACYVAHAGGQLCTYNELRIAAATAPAEPLILDYWMGDRVDDDTVLKVNSTSDTTNFDFAINVVTSTPIGPGYYCCTRAQ